MTNGSDPSHGSDRSEPFVTSALAPLESRVLLVDDEDPAAPTNDLRPGLRFERLQRSAHFHDDSLLIILLSNRLGWRGLVVKAKAE